MTTEHIQQIFTEYIKADKTQYAILLNGGWGCGKTYFWENTLEEISKKNDFKTIYVSLNGISKIDNLEYQLFIKLLPFINKQENKAIKNITTLFGNIINNVSSYFLKSNLSDIFKGVSIESFNFSKYIVCFDDLERCQIPAKEVLGFINNLVEHKNLKTIILANESEITKSKKDDQPKEYDQIKEKVIGRDLKFELDIFSTVPKLFEKYKDKETNFHSFLEKQQRAITEILIEYKQENLRIISFYFDTLERIFPALKSVEEKYIQEIILFSAIIAIEYKIGGLTSDDYKNFKGIDEIDEHFYSLYLSRTTNESEKEEEKRVKCYAEIFYEKYLDKKIKTYFFYPSIYSYVLSGYFNQTDLQNEINKRYPEVISKEVQDFRELIHYKFRELSDDDFKRLTKDVLQYAKEGKYFIYDYVQIANFFYFFSKNNLITESKEEIENILLEGLDIAKLRKQIYDSVLENLFHFGVENSDVAVIRNHIKEIHDKIKEEEYIANSKEFIDYLNKDEVELKIFFEKHFLSKELFPYINDDILLDTILNISNKQIFHFKELLKDRYNSSNIGEFLYEDIDCLKELQEGLSKHLENNKEIKPLRKFSYNELISTLKDNIKHLDETRRK
ncbi:MAG: P-loop NTPase fold protein [Bacteroidales bacterium]|nr:P-loop NTPase fold protein [Bacteroidales bacterium]